MGHMMTMSETQSPQTTQQYFTARFQPEAWVNDVAVDIDPSGEQEWTVSDAHVADAARIVFDGTWDRGLDRDDELIDDPAAPAWIREHDGPFTITVRPTSDETEHEVRGDITSDLRAAGHPEVADAAAGASVLEALTAYEECTGNPWAYTA